MQQRLTIRLAFDLAVLLVFVAAALDALTFTALARYMPLYVAVAGTLLSLVNLGFDMRRRLAHRRGQAFRPIFDPEAMAAITGEPDAGAPSLRRDWWFLGWIFAYVGLIAVIGLIAATAVFLVAFLKLEARLGWLGTVLALVVVLAALFGITEILHLHWPRNLAGL